eukprot:CAMPEP_0184479176 /NCGR_PEP_ID=MMETSP0113_2-20130426/1001_1 /TAXON_ID=91329 /ORGANISM="Norrisiella sphaerica, Strain BC52" /LENGTH=417 /DNA_ID=CAMNT_0026857201 /DNA_START=150 /DNA_END=1403 /DNA_ORIENTATION=+
MMGESIPANPEPRTASEPSSTSLYFEQLKEYFGGEVGLRQRMCFHDQYLKSQADPDFWPRKTKLPLLLYILGTEGSGHNFWEIFIPKAFPRESVVWFKGCVTPDFASLNVSDWLLDDYEQKLFKAIPALDCPTDRESGCGGKKLFLVGEDAHPCGNPRNVLRYPDLNHLLALDGKLFELRVLVSYRSPEQSVISNLKRGIDSTIQVAARTLQFGLISIATSAQAVPCEKLMLIPYDYMLKADQVTLEAYGSAIAHFLHQAESGLEEMTRVLSSTVESALNRHTKEANRPVDYKKRFEDFPECKFISPANFSACEGIARSMLKDFFEKRAESGWALIAPNALSSDFKFSPVVIDGAQLPPEQVPVRKSIELKATSEHRAQPKFELQFDYWFMSSVIVICVLSLTYAPFRRWVSKWRKM